MNWVWVTEKIFFKFNTDLAGKAQRIQTLTEALFLRWYIDKHQTKKKLIEKMNSFKAQEYSKEDGHKTHAYVLLLPPRQFCRRYVSFELRYGTKLSYKR